MSKKPPSLYNNWLIYFIIFLLNFTINVLRLSECTKKISKAIFKTKAASSYELTQASFKDDDVITLFQFQYDSNSTVLTCSHRLYQL